MTKKSYDHEVINLERGDRVPKSTFFNLSEEKKTRILEEAVLEFRDNNFDTASINKIVERSGISKGSFYQYFKDKEDLYLHIITIIGEKKIEYLTPAMMNLSEQSFYDTLRELYRSGIEFALENPDYLAIGNRMMKDTSSGILLKIKDTFGARGDDIFLQLLKKGQDQGDIRRDIDLNLISRLLVTMQMTVVEYYFEKYRELGYSMEIMEELDKFFDLLRKGIS